MNEKMEGVREYSEGYEVTLGVYPDLENRLVIHAMNEGEYNSTNVDLLDLIRWIKVNKPELLK